MQCPQKSQARDFGVIVTEQGKRIQQASDFTRAFMQLPQPQWFPGACRLQVLRCQQA
jgi:hypothetical protein